MHTGQDSLTWPCFLWLSAFYVRRVRPCVFPAPRGSETFASHLESRRATWLLLPCLMLGANAPRIMRSAGTEEGCWGDETGRFCLNGRVGQEAKQRRRGRCLEEAERAEAQPDVGTWIGRYLTSRCPTRLRGRHLHHPSRGSANGDDGLTRQLAGSCGVWVTSHGRHNRQRAGRQGMQPSRPVPGSDREPEPE